MNAQLFAILFALRQRVTELDIKGKAKLASVALEYLVGASVAVKILQGENSALYNALTVTAMLVSVRGYEEITLAIARLEVEAHVAKDFK